eukprot:s3800_g8.t1
MSEKAFVGNFRRLLCRSCGERRHAFAVETLVDAMNGIASILERKLGLERDFCAKGSSRSEPLQAKLVADITAVPVPAVILRQVQMHLEVPHLGHSIKIGEQSSDNLLSCQVSAACAKPLRTFVVMCQSHKAGQVRKMTGTSVTSSSSRSHHCLSWGCLLDGAVFITSWRCVAKWTAGVRGWTSESDAGDMRDFFHLSRSHSSDQQGTSAVFLPLGAKACDEMVDTCGHSVPSLSMCTIPR